MNKSYEAIIIGTGQAGPFLAIKMAKAGCAAGSFAGAAGGV